MSEKIFKDPIYGYISFPKEIVFNVIDTPQFQRLKGIIQTSYSPLYSSALHNRFVHSLGVYYLGSIAANNLLEAIEQFYSDETDCVNDSRTIKKVFLLACLLHDVGHAPFSHTGEELFLDENGKYDALHKQLLSCFSSKSLKNSIEILKKPAAAHEIMSSLVGIREFAKQFKNSDEKEFFVRCITGYYYPQTNIKFSIRNCFVSLLNSNVIDVDKLDYLIRDSFFSGFCSVKIDYLRLLHALTIKKSESNGLCEIAYKKSAISVLESVVYAHDFEKKWIQTHHVITYDSFLLRRIITIISKEYEKNLFSYDALTEKGFKVNDKEVFRLLSDDDIVFLMKKYFDQIPEVKEYFDRRIRKHAIWKSEAEFKAIEFSVSSEGARIKLNSALNATFKYQEGVSDYLINKSSLDKIRKELSELNDNCIIDDQTKRAQLTSKEGIIKFMDSLLNAAKKEGYNGDFILLQSNPFSSSFLKPDFSKTQIQFDSNGSFYYVNFESVAKPLSGHKNNEDEEFFYLFYDGTKPINAKKLLKTVYISFLD